MSGQSRSVSEVSYQSQVLYRHDVSGCGAEATGGYGFEPTSFEAWLRRAGEAMERLKAIQAARDLPLLEISATTDAVDEVEAAYQRLSDGARTVYFFGTGGSGLGGQTLAQFGGWSIPVPTTEGQRRRPATRFFDNLDPETLERLLAPGIAFDGLRFVVVSKSGNTPETLSQAIAALAAVRRAGLEARIPEMFLGITEPAVAGRHNGLRALFEHFGIPLLDHHTGIGGRFAVLTNVGLLPAVARGLDARKLLGGAQAVVDALAGANDAGAFPPAAGAATAIGLAKAHGMGIQVMMPYADRLGKFADWYVQLWAESLGKGGEGTTPVPCLGPVDQHSQLQLFMDGPRDHLVTFLRVPGAGTGPVIESDLAAIAGFKEMAGRPIGDLVHAQTQGVPEALLSAGRPVRLIDFVGYDEAGLGALLMHFMIETILAGFMLDLDPFDQPAVELGKRLTREKLAASG
ncbi:MAG: glucose-6-phosphate isomerase [Hyphomicrobiaceae bacterium]|nr:glucose-6-phosphate isomerase [Hyphomicrobiaceae bacterium]